MDVSAEATGGWSIGVASMRQHDKASQNWSQ